jgi:hypothetical protein
MEMGNSSADCVESDPSWTVFTGSGLVAMSSDCFAQAANSKGKLSAMAQCFQGVQVEWSFLDFT